MNTKKICETLKITPKALRVYEKAGLISPSRELNGYRNYSEENTICLREILLLKEMGFPLIEIKKLTKKNKMADSSHPFTRSLLFQLKIIKNKIKELENISTILENSINNLLNSKTKDTCDQYSQILFDCLEENKIQRQNWIDRWNFDHMAAMYDTVVTSSINSELKLFQNYAEVLEKVRSIIVASDSKKVLDMGCGTGNLCGNLSRELEVVGLDQSIEMLLIANEKYPKMKFRLGNFLDKPPHYPDKFDIVVSTYALHHLKPSE